MTYYTYPEACARWPNFAAWLPDYGYTRDPSIINNLSNDTTVYLAQERPPHDLPLYRFRDPPPWQIVSGTIVGRGPGGCYIVSFDWCTENALLQPDHIIGHTNPDNDWYDEPDDDDSAEATDP